MDASAKYTVSLDAALDSHLELVMEAQAAFKEARALLCNRLKDARMIEDMCTEHGDMRKPQKWIFRGLFHQIFWLGRQASLIDIVTRRQSHSILLPTTIRYCLHLQVVH